MRSAVVRCRRHGRRWQHAASPGAVDPMCATSLIAAKKEVEKHACPLRFNKVFVYFTNLKTRRYASALFWSV
jgi:hypothetical protein